jgi:hypothetical protein
MANNRIFWAVKAVAIAPYGSTSYVAVRGAQSCGITTTFNLDQVFELGQLAIYENIENIPDIEVTLEKVLDGKPLIYHLATRGWSSNDLPGRQNQRCQVAMSLFGDTNSSASGAQVMEVTMSGMYVSNVSYTLPVDGNAKESVTLVGNNKTFRVSNFQFTGGFDNTDTPVIASGGVQRRNNVVFGTGGGGGLDVNGQAAVTTATILPPDVAGISSSGTNNKDNNGNYSASIQNINITADLGREAIYELGHKAPYFRFVNFPVEISTEIEIISKSGDWVAATDAGILTGINTGNNLTPRTIRVQMDEGLNIYLGTNNKLQSVTMGGADTGGGNETINYKFVTYNDFYVTHPQDPT